MKKELAVQLKQAGFPQVFTEAKCYYDTQEKSETTYFVPYYGIDNETRYAVVPTLEELIEACGDDFGEVGLAGSYEDRGRWRASLGWDGCGGYENDVYAQTPTEAVANLWLALNKKVGG